MMHAKLFGNGIGAKCIAQWLNNTDIDDDIT